MMVSRCTYHDVILPATVVGAGTASVVVVAAAAGGGGDGRGAKDNF